ncbi:MAG: ATP synthase F1 subunit gamma [Candidatus Gracilibacteria bacterium]|jgi:F-type H+-transporting ATPase subunit gamma
MPNSVKEVKRKIKSINSTRQITKAMELVSTSKMKKAVNSAVNLRAYGYLAFHILSKLSQRHAGSHKFFQIREVKNILVIFFTTDKGLCGGLNANLSKKMVNVLEKLESEHKDAKIHFVAAGKKGADFLRRLGKEIEMFFPAFSTNPKFSDILPVSRTALKGFVDEQYDKVVVVYPDFVSTLLQKPVAKTLLPFSIDTFKEMVDELGSKFTKVAAGEDKGLEYKLEPSVEYVIDNIVPQLAESQLFQAVLEAAASEHSARMVAMQNANQAAKDLLDDLVLTYNQARQQAITAEIAEIASASTAQ